MKSFLKFLFVLISILLVSAGLAPILFKFLPFKFERIFDRLIMIFSLAAILAFVRIRKQTFVNYGLDWRSNSAALFVLPFISGILTLSFLLAIHVIFHNAQLSLRLSFGYWILEIVKNLFAAMLIAVLEEFFFRGFIFSTFRTRFAWNGALAMFVTSLFYASLHFVGEDRPFIGPHPNFIDSLRLMVAPFTTFQKWQDIWPAFLGLFIFGMILNSLVLKTKSLYPSIGLHAGCVFFVKMDGLFAEFFNRQSLFWGSSILYDGFLGWVFLILLGFFLKNGLDRWKFLQEETS